MKKATNDLYKLNWIVESRQTSPIYQNYVARAARQRRQPTAATIHNFPNSNRIERKHIVSNERINMCSNERLSLQKVCRK